jgi:hypothetical protein
MEIHHLILLFIAGVSIYYLYTLNNCSEICQNQEQFEPINDTGEYDTTSFTINDFDQQHDSPYVTNEETTKELPDDLICKNDFGKPNIHRNPMKNLTTDMKYNKNIDSNKSYIRDVDDSLSQILYAPISDVSCKYFNEHDTYLESKLHFDDYDQVDRVNKFRNMTNNELVGKSVKDVFDDLNGNNLVPQNDLLSREGTMYLPANKKFRTFDDSRWHYGRENSMNGGKFAGKLRGYDANDSTYPVIM